LLVIDKENYHYMLPDRDELQACVRDATTYTCDRNLPIYYAESDTPCEVQVYMKTPGQVCNCEKGHYIIRNYAVDNVDRGAIVILLNTKPARNYDKVQKRKDHIRQNRKIIG